jgi:NAD(P)-dependent dehydrogenase (short-subunit alcohol dehydrogenase family)
MGHFLLTELLLPLLKRTPGARVVSVASTVHLQVHGDALRPSSGEGKGDSGAPAAARSDIFTTRHWMDSYGNSKLAQILHMSELQNLLNGDTSTDLKVS